MEGFAREGYNLTTEELKELQEIEVEMLEEIDRVCKKCGITYCMSAGTQLGAIRHKGFIPWDDDADIAFLRPEYEKFREACETELDKERFYFQDYRNTPGYRWGYGKIRRKNTEFVRLNQEHMPYGQEIFVDIMPYDNVPDAYLPRKWHNFRCFLYRKCFYSEVGRLQEKGVKKTVYRLLSKIPAGWLYDSFTKFTLRSNKKENTKRIRILSIPVPGKEHGYLRSCFEDPVPTEFEGREFFGMKDYDTYLSYKYGDYMKLPPVEKREVHPVSKLTLLKAGKRA
ncbi:MAG: LicD family protein [Lachnospiraceae bacterium]|nr:LicD family protein [Lachnospiraceae bacterium]